MESVVAQLQEMGIQAEADCGDEGNEGVFQVGNKSIPIKNVADDSDDFDMIVADINRLIAPVAQYRKLLSSEGSDGWAYGVLKKEDWQSLGKEASTSLELLFGEVAPG